MSAQNQEVILLSEIFVSAHFRWSKTLFTYANLYSLERSMKRPLLLLRLQITLKRYAKNVKSDLLQSRYSANFDSRNP